MDGLVSPLSTWLPDPASVTRLRRLLDVRAVVLDPLDARWRETVPSFAACVTMVASGLPFQIAADGRYDRSGDRRRLRPALAAGKTVYVPQVHQVLPRLARLMVALRASVLGARREEASYLFLVDGRGRVGMGLHHDGAADSFWLQVEGRRTVTLGPRVPPGTPKAMRGRRPPARRDGRWRTFALEPGTLFYMPARTPHDVVCRERSLAVSMTWSRAGYRGAEAAKQAAAAWDVVSGRVTSLPAASRRRLWTQVPIVAAGGRGVQTPDGRLTLSARAHRIARRLGAMPSFSRSTFPPGAVAPLLRSRLVGPRDLPLVIQPERPGDLEGWAFR